jgi:acetoin:2,6-dichlorophenolindophenol oxidoreductase subunit beta
MRMLSYADAIREAHAQLLASDARVFVLGQGLWSPWYVGSSMRDLDKQFGRDRIIDSPVSESAITGTAVGAAIAGMRPIVVHPRMDFMLLATDAIVNQAANWSYMFAGQAGAPVVIRAIVNRGGEQGAQHSQALQAIFAHIPGLKVVMPATPYDAKGLLIAAVYDGNPVMYIDDRWLYDQTADVPEEPYQVPIGKAAICRHGRDITIVGASYAAAKAVEAAVRLHEKGIDAEVIDLRSIKPWDRELVISSIKRTGRLLVTDTGWRSGGIAAEIIATAAELALDSLITRPARVTLPDVPAPTSKSLETSYYFGADAIAAAAEQLVVRGREHALGIAG